uniref:Uncharacterized protein n=1 Tax=Mus musculus TaxID=10090 RepID=Q8C4H7_MOUSE|nr:unnamed protein product [Mus musculus]
MVLPLGLHPKGRFSPALSEGELGLSTLRDLGTVLPVDSLRERWSFCMDCTPRDNPSCTLWEDARGVGVGGQHYEGWSPDSPSCGTILPAVLAFPICPGERECL